MRATFFVLAFTAIVASAAIVEPRGLADFPPCAQKCLLKAPHKPCGITDYHCLCHNDGFQKAGKACIDAACKGEDLAKAVRAQLKTCKGQ